MMVLVTSCYQRGHDEFTGCESEKEQRTYQPIHDSRVRYSRECALTVAVGAERLPCRRPALAMVWGICEKLKIFVSELFKYMRETLTSTFWESLTEHRCCGVPARNPNSTVSVRGPAFEHSTGSQRWSIGWNRTAASFPSSAWRFVVEAIPLGSSPVEY